MNVVCVVALWFNTAIAVLAASRLVFAVARDGVLPYSGWVSQVSNGQPKNAVIVVWVVSAIVSCTILPSSTAFTSLVSAAGVPSAAAYGLICLSRLILTPKTFPKPRWSLGRLRRSDQAEILLAFSRRARHPGVLHSTQFNRSQTLSILNTLTIISLTILHHGIIQHHSHHESFQ